MTTIRALVLALALLASGQVSSSGPYDGQTHEPDMLSEADGEA